MSKSVCSGMPNENGLSESSDFAPNEWIDNSSNSLPTTLLVVPVPNAYSPAQTDHFNLYPLSSPILSFESLTSYRSEQWQGSPPWSILSRRHLTQIRPQSFNIENFTGPGVWNFRCFQANRMYFHSGVCVHDLRPLYSYILRG